MRESVAARLARYRDDPVTFCKEVLSFEAWSKQREVLESVRDHSQTAVRSCHGPGKTAVSARCALWYLSVFENSRVVVTAPTTAQLRDVFFREIAAAHRASKGFIGGQLYSSRLEIAPTWFLVGIATDRGERLQGQHSEHLLLVVDEANGVDESIYEAASGFLTSEQSRVLLIGNPVKPEGEFYRAFTTARDLYNPIVISAFDTPAFTGERVPRSVARKLVSKKWVEDARRRWGESSPAWESRVLAQFPTSSEDTVVSLGDLEDAQRRTLEPGLPLVLGCDVARYGSDETVIAVRRGDVVRIVQVAQGRDLMKTTGAITRVARELEREHGRKPIVVVDDTGVGGGVTDRLRELNEFHVVAFNGSNSSKSKEYPNSRSETWPRRLCGPGPSQPTAARSR